MVYRLEAEYWNKIDFVYLHQFDEDNYPIFEKYDMVWRPVFVLIAPDGTLITKWFGALPEAEIRKFWMIIWRRFSVMLKGAHTRVRPCESGS